MTGCTPAVPRRAPPRRVALAALSLLLSAMPPVAVAAEPGGTLEGTVTIGPELWSRRMRFSPYEDRRTASRPRAFAAHEEIRNVVVYLEGDVPGEPASQRHVMTQVDSAFVPHVLPVVRGSVVDFANADPVFHNVFSLSRPAVFDLGRYPRGVSRSVRFDEAGVVKVFCHIHSDMSAVVLVLDNAHFAVPDADGRYRIEGVPPGDYRLWAWHERARPIAQRVRVRADRATTVDFTIPLAEATSRD